MDVKGYEKLNSRAKEIAFRKALDAARIHIYNVSTGIDWTDNEQHSSKVHLDNALSDLTDLKSMALFAKFQDNKKWWRFW